jgi:hypothetical protein
LGIQTRQYTIKLTFKKTIAHYIRHNVLATNYELV